MREERRGWSRYFFFSVLREPLKVARLALVEPKALLIGMRM
jgi:hypothetical protein